MNLDGTGISETPEVTSASSVAALAIFFFLMAPVVLQIMIKNVLQYLIIVELGGCVAGSK